MSSLSPDQPAGPLVVSAGSACGASRGIEAVFLVLVCGASFFVGLGRHDFIKTEGLRAIVVSEMLERPGLSMPSVHHRPYLKKPPLYAWTAATLARIAGRFDEQIARLPSAVAGTLLILLLYAAAEWCIGRGAGIPAAAFGLANTTVLDYSVRAELDMGFAFLTTLAILLAYPALHRGGWAGVVCWLGCYLAATVGAMWKGPHSLIFLWVPLLAYGWRKRNWRWLWNPGQVVGLLLSMGVLIGWAVSLSGYAGKSEVGKIAAMELVSRLVPLSGGDLLSVLYAVPVMAIVVLPASLFVMASFLSGVVYSADDRPADRSAKAVVRFCVGRLRQWWGVLARDRFTEFLLFWLGANLVWTAIVPAKSPRYWLPMFAPAFLLAAGVLHRRMVGGIGQGGERRLDVAWRGTYAVVGGVGVLALVAAVVAAVADGPTIGGVSLGPAWAWLVLGSGCVVVAGMEFMRRVPASPIGRCVGLIVVALACKPVLADVWWPARERSDTQRYNAAAIDDLVPAGQPVFVLGTHELPDVAFYSRRRFQWIDEPAQAADFTDAASAHYLLRTEDLEKCVSRLGFDFVTELEFVRADKELSLVRIELPARR